MRDSRISDPSEIARALSGIRSRDLFLAANFTEPVDLLVSRDTAQLLRLNSRGRRALVGRGDIGQVAALLERNVEVIGDLDVAFLPYGIDETYPWLVESLINVPSKGAWEWLSSFTAPPFQPGEEHCGPLAPEELLEVEALLPVANPDASIDPSESGHIWWGYRTEGGQLLSICAMNDPDAGTNSAWRGVHLASFGTHPDSRGKGIGRALLAAMTRHGIAHHGFVHFGVWIHNKDAIRLYRRLGYSAGAQVQTFRK